MPTTTTTPTTNSDFREGLSFPPVTSSDAIDSGTNEPSEMTLRVRELSSAGERTAAAQQAEAFVALFLANGRQINNPNLQKQLSAEYQNDPNLQNRFEDLKQELTELYSPEGERLWMTGLETATDPNKIENLLLTGLVKLFLKGQMSGKLLKELIGGGLNYQKVNPHRPTAAGIDEVAHFFPPSQDRGSQIFVYEALFKEGMVPEKALYHEIGHALLLHDGLLYEHGNFRSNAPPDEIQTNPAPPLTKAERLPLQNALTTPARQRPWETPYVAQLLDELSKSSSAALQKHIWDEMLAERIRLWFESDGSLGDFIRLRLENSTAMRDIVSRPAGISEVHETSSFETFSMKLDNLLLDLSRSQGYDPAQREKLLRVVDAHADALGNLAEPLKAFLDESYHLHARYSRLLGKDRHAALITALNTRPLAVADYPFGVNWDEPELSLLATDTTLKTNSHQTFWRWLMKMFAQLFNLFKI